MYELIVKLVYDEMNICRCIKKSIAVQGELAIRVCVTDKALSNLCVSAQNVCK